MEDILVEFGAPIIIALVAALAAGLLVRKLGLPVIVGYMLAGIIVGPYMLGFVHDVEIIELMGEIGVILLLFALGLSFSLDELFKEGKVVLIGGIIQMTGTALIGFGLGELLGWSSASSIFFGCMIALSSTMVIMKSLIDKGELDTTHGRIIMGILLVDDISLIPMMIILPSLGSDSGVDFSELGFGILKAVFFIAAILFLGKVVVPRILSWVSRIRSSELFMLTIVVIAFLAAEGAHLLGVSMAMGAFMAGIIIGQSRFARQALNSIITLRDIFSALFFVSLGMMANIPFIQSHISIVLIMMLVVMLGKFTNNYLVMRGFGYNVRNALFVGLGLAQIGEFSMVLGSMGRSQGILNEDILSLATAVAIITMTIVPLTMNVSNTVYKFVTKTPILRFFFTEKTKSGDLNTPVEMLSHHAIICGHGSQGAVISAILKKRNFKYIIIESDPVIASELREAGENVVYGDSSVKEVLLRAHADRAVTIAITHKIYNDIKLTAINALAINPRLTITATAESKEMGHMLTDIGVTEIVYSDVEATLEIARYTLKRMGATTVETQYLINKAREAEEESVPIH